MNLYNAVGNDLVERIDYLGLSAADIALLQQMAKEYSDQMTKKCQRVSPGWVNNLCSTLQRKCGDKTPYLGCGEQAAALARQLNGTGTDAKWRFYYVTVNLFVGIHQFIVAVSDDPKDAQVVLDTWGSCYENMGGIRGLENAEDSGYSTTKKAPQPPPPQPSSIR